GGLDSCGTGLDTFDRAAWYAGELAGADQLGVLAVNIHGEIVGTYLGDSGCLPRPFVYLPNANYGRAAGMHDLISCSGGSSETIGYAWDITDDGLVVGGVGGRPDTLADGTCRAVAWDLANSCASINLDGAPSTRNLWSIAIAAEPVASVGAELRIVGLTGDTCPLWRRNARFSLTTGTSGPIDLTLPDPYPSMHPTYVRSLRSWACDVANLANPVGAHDWPSDLDPDQFTPGVGCPGPFSPDTLACDLPFSCGAHFRWGSSWPQTEFFRRDPTVTPTESIAGQMTRVRSISHAPALNVAIDDFVVAGQFRGPATGCPWRPAVWRYGAHGVAIELPLPSTVQHATAQRWREAIGSCGTDTVVGWKTNFLRPIGLVWSRCPTAGPWDFCVTDANELMSPYSGSVSDRYEILQVYEVFNTGELLAIVRDSLSAATAQGYYAVILGLRGDANGDFSINSQDLAAVLNSWGSDSAMSVDFEKDGVINAADLAIVLSEWTGSSKRPLALTCGPAFCPPETIDSAEGEPPALTLALAAVGFESVDAFRVTATRLDERTLEFTCQLMYCFMRSYSEETK
ncbi:MAG: dockerin type I domain-containing protein, partial [Planctomycetota bacterium]|nr:dockerin type I domain-containing protein [Planctomycetota bacterium]